MCTGRISAATPITLAGRGPRDLFHFAAWCSIGSALSFTFINQWIGNLLEEESEIRLPPEMAATERKLNAVKGELKRRAREAKMAEQRKNDLVMYLAHDIRTPLTSVIGYLSFLSEAPDMPVEQRAKYVNITLDKAYRLEKMVDEFLESPHNLQVELRLQKEPIDLYYI